MPTNFPTSVDNFTNPTANDSLNLPSHSTQHANANDAIEAIEDYLLNGAGSGGLVLLNSTSFTSATSVNVDSVFSSSYDNYEIHINATSNSGGFVPTIRYRTGGTTATTNYQWTRTYFLGSVTATSQGNAQASSQIARLDSAGGYVVVQLSNVNLATPTFGLSRSYDNTGDHDIFGIYHSTATAYDGFNLTLGTTTGNVRTYGIRK